MPRNENEPKVRYEIETTQDKFRIDIPESWKVTYGLLHPGTRNPNPGQGYTLRIYESETKQRAVFQNVISFRDLSIPIMKEIRVQGEQEDGGPWQPGPREWQLVGGLEFNENAIQGRVEREQPPF